MADNKKILEMAVDKQGDNLKYDYDGDGAITAADARLADRQNDYLEPNTASGQQYNALSLANQYLDQYRNSKFNYDKYSDPVYNQAREAYIRQGQLAAKDVQAQAAGMTGGYGNSYGAMAAQQQYNQALTQMNDIIPQLQNNAYNRWQDEQARNLSLAQIYLDRENQLYNRAYNEAVLGAQYKVYEGLHDLGINTGHYESLEQADEDWTALTRERTQKEWDQADTTFAWNIALNAAQFKDYSKLQELGIDTSSQEKQDLIDRAIVWAQYGDYSLLRELGVDTSYLQALQDYELMSMYGDGSSGTSGGSGGFGGSDRSDNNDSSTKGFWSSLLDNLDYDRTARENHYNPGVYANTYANAVKNDRGWTNVMPTAAGALVTNKDGSEIYISVDARGNVTEITEDKKKNNSGRTNSGRTNSGKQFILD